MMCKRWIILILFLALLAAQSALAEDYIDVRYTVSFRQKDARSMLAMINDFRTGDNAWYWNPDNETKTWQHALKPLVYDYDLERVAMQRAAECAMRYSHTRPNGEDCFTAYDEMIGDDCWAMGENIAAGYNAYEKAGEVFVGWREDNDPYSGQGHRRNMLSKNYNCIGIGHVIYNGYHFWAQALGYRATPNTSETPVNDSSTQVTASVSEYLITSISFTGLEAQSLVVGYESSSPLPALSAKIKVSGRWPGNRSADKVSISPDWLSNDPLCVSIDAGQATGMALGSTTLTAAFAGKTFSLPVSVEHESLVRNDLILPAGLQAIAAESFFAVSAKAAVVPAGVQSIGDQAFASCANLYQIYIPSSVRSISESAFSGCPALTYICCPEGSTAAAYARAHGYTVLRSQ